MKALTTLLLLLSVNIFAGDTLIFVPQHPNTADSITFRLFTLANCCCAVYHDNQVQVSDTQIFLNYSVDNQPCAPCQCLTAGSWATFKTSALKAGTYVIYKQETIYCPPLTPCPYMAVMPVRMGTITVIPATDAKMPGTTFPTVSAMILNAATNAFKVTLALSGESRIGITMVDAKGREIHTSVDKSMPAGNHEISGELFGAKSNRSPGIYFFKVTANDCLLLSSAVVIAK
jgi:hypothetical protein